MWLYSRSKRQRPVFLLKGSVLVEITAYFLAVLQHDNMSTRDVEPFPSFLTAAHV